MDREACIQKFEQDFTASKCRALVAVTFYRDVDAVEVASDDPDVITWAMAVPDDPDDQKLEALALKWLMDVDEMFYVGDETSSAKGLLNGGYKPNGAPPDTVLVEPVAFAHAAVAGNVVSKPCKWLQIVDKKRFEYTRSRVKFKLAWPRRAMIGGVECFVGGIGAVHS